VSSNGWRFSSDRPNRAAIRAAFGQSPTSGLGRDLQRRANRVEIAAKRLCSERTGRLRRTIRQETGRNQHGQYIHVVAGDATTPYLGYVLYGTDPHIIRPRTKKALRFTVHGRVVFAKVVHHPGNAGRNFLGQALSAAR
jgi:hypothetical protein